MDSVLEDIFTKICQSPTESVAWLVAFPFGFSDFILSSCTASDKWFGETRNLYAGTPPLYQMNNHTIAKDSG